MISLIVAAAQNNAIGKQGQLLWHLPKDLKFFKNTTWGHPVIMGRKTFESVNKPLPGRTNIVITSNHDWQHQGVIVTTSLDAAIQQAEATHVSEIFIIGGGEIYRQSMNLADRIYMTRVHASLEGDTFFPDINDTWELKEHSDFGVDEKHAYPFSIQTWDKKRPTL